MIWGARGLQPHSFENEAAPMRVRCFHTNNPSGLTGVCVAAGERYAIMPGSGVPIAVLSGPAAAAFEGKHIGTVFRFPQKWIKGKMCGLCICNICILNRK
jgi:hypothetical protein